MAKRKNTDQVQINVRMREGLRAKLEQSAKRNRESLNREIVDRLERSFDRQELLVDALTLAYSSRLAGIILALGKAMDDAGTVAGLATIRSVGDHWYTDPFAYNEAIVAAAVVLRALRPRTEYVPPSPKMLDANESLRNPGLLVGASVIAHLRKPKDKWARSVRDLLREGMPHASDDETEEKGEPK
jgi:hypothetical protein